MASGSTLNRSRLRRGPWRRKKHRPPRPGVTETPRSTAAWKRLCAEVRERDRHACRRCGRPILGAGGQVDHLVPRRLCASPEIADQPDNLALLCTEGGCHSFKTQVVEPALYRGDVQTFTRFYLSLGAPFPPEDLRIAAYFKLTEVMRG